MARTTTGIDIGLRTSRLLRGSFKGNTFHATNFAVAAHQSEDIPGGWSAVQPGFKPLTARVGLTGRDVNIRYVRVPRVPDWQLRNLMRFEVAEIGDQSGAEVASDFNLLPELPEIEGEDVVLLAMARESLLEAHLDGLTAMGGTLDAFSPCPLALYNAWMRFGVLEDDTVLVANIGHDNIDVIIVRGPDLLFARNLSGGSRLFDDAIAQRFDISAKKAEEIKVDMATLAPGAQYATPNHERASRAILGAAGQVLSLLQSTILFCKSQVKISGLKVDRVMLCGGGAALDGLPQYLSGGMGVPVELFDAFRVVDTSSLSPEEVDELEEYKLESVLALGLATMASDPEAYSLEILPEKIAKKREFMGGTIWLIAAALLGVIYLGFRAKRESDALVTVQGQNSSLSRRVKTADATHLATKDLLDANTELEKLATDLWGTAGQGEQVARVFAYLDDNLPADFWVTKMTSSWNADEIELGIERSEKRPILSFSGRHREGVSSPAVQFNGFRDGLGTRLPDARINGSHGSGTFSIDMTLFAPPEPEAADAENGED